MTDRFSDNPIELWQQALAFNKAIAVIRADQIQQAAAMAHAVAAGGIKLIEITWNSDRPQELITQLRAKLPNCLIGAGTILDLPQLEAAINAGAQFIFSPHFDLALLKTARDRYNIPLIPGALSPTEIVAAWQAGATNVKVFPIQAMGGANYIESLQSPLGQIPLIPTGGVTIDNAKSFLDAGAIAVGLGSNLFSISLIKAQNWQGITQRTKTLLNRIK